VKPIERQRLIAATALAAMVPLIAWSGIVQSWNDGAADALARLLPRPNSPWLERIVLLAIDDRTVAQYGPLPLSRAVIARGLGGVGKPKVLAVDLLFSEAAPEGDAELARVLGGMPNVVLAAALSGNDGSNGKHGNYAEQGFHNSHDSHSSHSSHSWVLPLPLLPRSAVGHVHALPGPDGVVRSVSLAKSGGGDSFWALGLEAARLTGSTVPPAPLEMRIRYAGGEPSFRTISFADVLEGRVAPAEFAEKVVVFGVTAQGAGDRRITPVSAGLDTPGIEIHANIIRTLLDGDALRPLPLTGEVALLLATIALSATTTCRFSRLAVAVGLLLIPVGAYAALRASWIVPVASATIAYSSAALLASLAATREARAGRADYALRLQAIAHEIKTPLTAISASSEMVADTSIAMDCKTEVAALIHKESQRLAGIVGAFLDVERISAGVLRLQRKPADLAGVAGDAIERAGLLAMRKRIRIVSELRPATVMGDPELLGFAVYNLLTNALKYSPKDSMVTVTAGARGGSALLTVDDHGSGISPAEQAHIFDRFYRQKKHAAGGPAGSGFGLALVKEIVTQHGGRVQVESSPGRGSRFTMEIPQAS
jgi:signal transduction histidine kinase